MIAKIQKWGNSQGLRIPKPLLDSYGLHENDTVLLVPTEDSIQIKKVQAKRHRSLEERLTAFYGKPIDEIGRIDGEKEVDWGQAMGDEVW